MPVMVYFDDSGNVVTPPHAKFSELVSSLRLKLIELRDAATVLAMALARQMNTINDAELWVYVRRDEAANLLEQSACMSADCARFPVAHQGIIDARKLILEGVDLAQVPPGIEIIDEPDEHFWVRFGASDFAAPRTIARLDQIIADLETMPADYRSPGVEGGRSETKPGQDSLAVDSDGPDSHRGDTLPDAVNPGQERTAAGATADGQVNLKPGARALAAAYQLRKEGRPVSLNAACKLAGVDRANVRSNYPEVVQAIRDLSAPDRTPKRGVYDRRTGRFDVVEEEDS